MKIKIRINPFWIFLFLYQTKERNDYEENRIIWRVDGFMFAHRGRPLGLQSGCKGNTEL
jgi:hypothetical protein